MTRELTKVEKARIIKTLEPMLRAGGACLEAVSEALQELAREVDVLCIDAERILEEESEV